MGKWRVWHSAKAFCEFIVDNTLLANIKDEVEFKSLPESDAAKGGEFHKVPDHIKKILYLDAADMIVEYDSDPVLCIEETKEAGTGHNGLQRFARMAAAAENNVPAIYIMPEACIISRKDVKPRWDSINPMVFHAFDSVMDIFKIPALFYYYPSDYRNYPNPEESPHLNSKGIIYNEDIVKYPACPYIDDEMENLFKTIDVILSNAINKSPATELLNKRVIKERRDMMRREFYTKLGDRKKEELSPITATITLETNKLLNFLSEFSDEDNDVSELLSSRKESVIYQCDAKFRGDPYAGTLAAIDYLLCRCGKTYEERDRNLVLCFGDVKEESDSINVISTKCSVDDFIKSVHNSGTKNLLTAKRFGEIKPKDIGRYYMQVRYGSTYSKVKHIRVFSYFADAIIFKDGALWREA